MKTKELALVTPPACQLVFIRLAIVIVVSSCANILILGNPAAAQSSKAQSTENADATNRRVLRFPTDRAVGIIYWRSAPASEQNRLWMFGDEWRRVADARGNVRLPAGGEVRLDISKVASSDLSGLDQLDPEALQAIGCRWTDLNDEALAHIGRLTGLRMLDLQSTPITDAGVAHLANLQKLRWLSLEAFATNKKGFGAGDEAMKTVAQFPELEVLRLRDTKVTDAGLKYITKIKSLHDLDLSGTTVSDAGMILLKELPKLEFLRLGVYREGAKVTDEGLKTVGELTSLRSLDLAGTNVTNDGLVHLHPLTQLKRLDLEHTKVTEAGLANLEPLQALEELRLYLGTPVTDVGAAHLAKLKSLRRISDNLQVTDQGVGLLATLPNLETIELYGPGVTDEGARLISQAKSLQWLWFQNCQVTDAGLAALADMPNLELLRVLRTRVKGEGFQYLQNLPKLFLLGIDFGGTRQQPLDFQPSLEEIGKLRQVTSLEIGGKGLTSADLAFIANMRQLKELRLEDSLLLDDDGIRRLTSLSNLTQLSARKGTVTDDGLKELAKFGSLKSLSLEGNFTDEGLKPLAELRSLEMLFLQSPNLTPAGKSAIEKQLPALQMTQ